MKGITFLLLAVATLAGVVAHVTSADGDEERTWQS